MVSCLMGDSTALASAIVRCCLMFAMRYYKVNTCSVNTSITRGDLENNR